MNYLLIPPDLIQVFPDDKCDYSIICQFVDGKVTRYKMGDKLSGVFEVLKDRQIFRDKLTILNGTAAWDLTGKRDETQCLDLDPWVLYNAEDVTEEFM